MHLIQTREHPGDYHHYLNGSNASWFVLFFLYLFTQIYSEQYVLGLVLGPRDRINTAEKNPILLKFPIQFLKEQNFPTWEKVGQKNEYKGDCL